MWDWGAVARGLVGCLVVLSWAPAARADDETTPVRPELVCSSDADCVLAQRCCGCPLEMRARNRAAAAEEDERCARRMCRGCDEPTPEQPIGARCEAGQCVAIEAAGTPAAAPYRYDPATGRCLDSANREGLNHPDLSRIIATLDADCVDLSGRDLNAESSSLDGPVDFERVSFRGSDISNVTFPPYGAPGHNTPLQGADLRGAQDVYGMPLQGLIDEYTRYDETCTVIEHDGQRAIDCPLVLQ